MPIIQNVFTKTSYFEDGQYKNRWHKVGCIKISNGGKTYLRLFHLPEVTFHVMEDRGKPEENAGQLPVIE